METIRKVTFDKDFSDKVSNYRTMIFEADVENCDTTEAQKCVMKDLAAEISSRYEVGEINSIPAIAATRKAYKACGKDPNRYRPSQEQMMRRIVKGLGLYNVNALVDAGNELSLKTGCSVGCFDADKVKGNVITLGIGRAGEPYEGIGRGELNIEGLPVFRDSIGGIGSPTSDNVRTMLTLDTKRIFVTVHLFDPTIDAYEVKDLFVDIFKRWGRARNIKYAIFAL